MKDAHKGSRWWGSRYWPDVSTAASAQRVLRRHWGGWLFAGTNLFTAATALYLADGARSDASLIGHLAYFIGLATIAGGLTWLLSRENQTWAGWLLLALLAWNVVQSYIAALDEPQPPGGVYLTVRLLIALSVVNGIRAATTLRPKHSTPHTSVVAGPPRPTAMASLSQAQRLWLFATVTWVAVVALLLFVFDPDAAVVDGDVARVVAILIGPPVLVALGYYAHRTFVIPNPHLGDLAASSDSRAKPTTLKQVNWSWFLASAAVGMGLVLSVAGVLFILVGPAARYADPAASNLELPLPDLSSAVAPAPVPQAEPETVVLDSILAFDRPAECDFGPTLTLIREAMIGSENGQLVRGRPFAIPGYPDLLEPTFQLEEDGWVSSSVAISGLWYGLQVSEIYQEALYHSYLQIRFLEDPEKVRSQLNKHGFDLPPVGQTVATSGEGMPTDRGVRAVDGGAALLCG